MLFKLKPDYILAHVNEIDLDVLKEKGVKGFVFDLDNTIMAPHAGELTEDMQEWLTEVQKDFTVAVVSNNRHAEYIKQVAGLLDFKIYGKANKPRRKILRKAIKEMDLEPEQIAMVGDRPLTDIWVGKRIGALTILVDPLTKIKENGMVKALRKLERTFIKE